MEQYSLAPNLQTHQNYVVFNHSPFVLDTLQVSIVATSKSTSDIPLGESRILVLGVDYMPGLLYVNATAAIKNGVYGAISFVDKELEGEISVTYSPLGAAHELSSNQLNGFLQSDKDPLAVTWDTAFGIIAKFPITNQVYNSDTPVGLSDAVSALLNTSALLQGNAAALSPFDFNKHINNYDNPHGDTALSLGIGNVPNWGIADVPSVVGGVETQGFVSPWVAAESTRFLIGPATTTFSGTMLLNSGLSAGDDVSDTKALTAGGLLALIQSGTRNALNGIFNNRRTKATFRPFPIEFPTVWMGGVYDDFESLVVGVQDYVGVTPLIANKKTGSVYFPSGVNAPNLSLVKKTPFNVTSSVRMPLAVYGQTRGITVSDSVADALSINN